MSGAIEQPCFCRDNAMEVPEGRSQHLQQCWMLCWYRTYQCLSPVSFGWDQSLQGGGEAEQEAALYLRPCSADSPASLCWASNGHCEPGSQRVPPQELPGHCHHRRCQREAEDRVSAGPQLSESPAQPFGCQDLQLPKLCLPFLDPFSPFFSRQIKTRQERADAAPPRQVAAGETGAAWHAHLSHLARLPR